MTLKLSELIVRFRWLMLLLPILLVFYAASGGRFLEFTTDYRVFFSEENPQLQAFEKLQNTYTKNDNVLFVLAPKDGNVFTKKTLFAIEKLTESAWQIPHSLRVDSITNFQHTYADGDDLVVEDLFLDVEDFDEKRVARGREVALNEPLLLNRLISPDADVTGVNVTIQLPGKNESNEVVEVVSYVRTLVAQLKQDNPEIEVYLTGMTMMNNAFSESSQKDMSTLVPAMFAIVIIVLGLMLRSISGTVATVVVIFLSIFTAMGLTGWLGIKLTPPSSSAPTIILTMAVAHSVHILVNFIHAMRAGATKQSAMVESLRINIQPIFLTSLTTAIGFMSMNFSDAPPFRDLGNIVAMGVGAAFVLSITVLPALMMILPVRIKPSKSKSGLMMDRFSDFVVCSRGKLLWGMALFVLVLVSFIPQNELNDNFVNYFDKSVDFRSATDFTTENLTGIYLIEYSLPAGEPNGISRPEYLRDVERFAKWFRLQKETIHVNSITDVMKRLNRNMHNDEDSYYRVPEQRDLAAQYLLLYEMSLPFGLDLNNQINVDKSATRFTVTLETMTSNDLIEIEQRASQWLEQNAPSMAVEGSSPSVMFAHIGARNIRSMLTGTVLALILISGILIFALRSFKIGLISMIPNLVPAGMAFGLWGLVNGQVGLGLSVVIGMTLGIVVDDTVHFLSKYLRARREKGLDSQQSVRYAFSTVGTALWVTSLVLFFGFLVLSTSVFKLNSDMGLVTAITIAFALIADFLFLPPLLMKIEGKKK